MTNPKTMVSTKDDKVGRFPSILLLLFFGSGCCALIYEIVWFQLLNLVIGSSAISLGVLLGTFMGGMCLGSLLLPRIIPETRHPLRVYALLEFGIALIGVGLLYLMPYVGELYTSSVGHGLPGILLRAGVAVICLTPPTVLMGATLPAIARWVEATPQGVSRLGFFYGANIAGAVIGCVTAGFYLLRVYDVIVATYVGASINTIVALISLSLAALAPHRTSQPRREKPGFALSRQAWPVYIAIGISGLTALGAEVIWTRQLSLLLGASVYTFSIILAVYLVGLGIGSSVGSFLPKGGIDPLPVLIWCQVLLAPAIAWSAYVLSVSLPYWPIDPTLPASPWQLFQLDVLRCLWAIFPATILWGASFPLALATIAKSGQEPGRLVGGVYAANTVGAIVGAVGFSLLMLDWLGTQQAQQALIVASGLAVLFLFVAFIRGNVSGVMLHSPTGRIPQARWFPRAAIVTVPLAAVIVLVAVIPSTPQALIGYGRNLATWDQLPEFIYTGEGMNASVAVSQFSDGTRNFHVSGKVVASNEWQDMRLQRMLGHAPAIVHPCPKSVLIVGCGAGVTAGSFVVHPDVERIVICEIEPLIPPAAGKYFSQENHAVMNDPRVEIVYDDARHFIVTTDERFDIITSDPIHPWVKGAAALYSAEYFELCKQRLNEGGVVTQWVPLYETNLAAVQSEIATFFDAFPEGTIWSNDYYGQGYDIVLMGTVDPLRIDADDLQSRLDRDDHGPVLDSLEEVQLGSAVRLLSTYAGRACDLKAWLADAEINRDRNFRLQYLAGMGLNEDESEAIYDSLVAFRRFPENLIVATGPRDKALRTVLEQPE